MHENCAQEYYNHKICVPVFPPESMVEFAVLAAVYPEHATVDFREREVQLPHRDRDVSYSRVRFKDIIRLAECIKLYDGTRSE